MGVLRNVFGRDNLRDESGDNSRISESDGRGRSQSLDSSKNKASVKPEYKDSSADPKTMAQAMLAQRGDFGGEVNSTRKSGKRKVTKDEKGKSQERERDRKANGERGRSRSKRGEGRKLNLWEEV